MGRPPPLLRLRGSLARGEPTWRARKSSRAWVKRHGYRGSRTAQTAFEAQRPLDLFNRGFAPLCGSAQGRNRPRRSDDRAKERPEGRGQLNFQEIRSRAYGSRSTPSPHPSPQGEREKKSSSPQGERE